MKNTTNSRALGIALRTLYPGSFTSHQGIVFRVISPGSELLSGISTDHAKTEKVEEQLDEHPELVAKAFKIIQKQLEHDTGILLPESKRPLKIIVPGKIDLRIDEILEKVYCTNPKCGTIWKLEWLKNQGSKRLPKCKLCGSRVEQAPIFIPVMNDGGISIGGAGMYVSSGVQSMPDRTVYCHYMTQNAGCRAPDTKDHKCVPYDEFEKRLGSLAIRNPQRSIGSLRLCNPDCPKDLHVPDIPLVKPKRQSNLWFSTDFPRESLNVPLSASAVKAFHNDEEPDVDEINEVTSKLLDRFFDERIVDFQKTKFTNMILLETVYGYRMGNQNTGSTTSYIGIGNKTVIGRITNTQGFQITIKPKIYEMISSIKEKKNLNNTYKEILEVILHSLKHALLIEMPIFTGLDEGKFHGTFEINDDGDEWSAKVYVYDTEDGGNAGFSTIMRNQEIFPEMLDDVRLRRIHCPVRECSQACKYCLYIKNCGFVNRKLNRHLLIDSGILVTE